MIRPAFDALRSQGKCLIALAACVSIAEEAFAVLEDQVCGPSGSPLVTLSGTDFIAYLARQEPFRSKGKIRYLNQYIEVDGSGEIGIELSYKNKVTLQRMAKAIAILIRERASVLEPRLREVELRASASAHVGRLSKLSAIFSKLNKFSQSQINDKDHILNLLRKHDINPLNKDDSVSTFIDDVIMPCKDIDHHKFSFLDLFHIDIIKSQILGLCFPSTSESQDLGLYMVIREARGFAETPEQNANLIVRDVLLLLPNSLVGKDMQAGVYVSTVDRGAFQIHLAEADTGTWHLAGQLSFSPDRQQRLDLRFPAMSRENRHVRFGLLSGSILRKEGARLAAWKVIVIRSPEMRSVSYSGRVECLIFQLMSKHPDHVATACQALNLTGVLHNTFLASEDPSLRMRRISFRRLVEDDVPSENHVSFDVGGFVRSKIETILGEVADNFLDDGSIGFGFAAIEEKRSRAIGETVDKIENELKRSWSLLNPAQIAIERNYDRGKETNEISEVMKEDIKNLVDMEKIFYHKNW